MMITQILSSEKATDSFADKVTEHVVDDVKYNTL